MKITCLLPFAFGLCLSATTLQGASLLLKYEFINYFPDDTNAFTYLPTTTTNPAVITGGAVTSDGPTSGSSTVPKIRRMNISGAANENWNSSPFIVHFRTQAVNTTLAAAVANDSFFTITLNPNELVDLTQLTFFSRNNALNDTNDSGFAIRSSVTGSTNLLHVDDLPGRRNVEAKQPGDNFYSVDLTAYEGFRNLTDPVTFRFYLFSDSNITETDFGTISFYGVPEPASAALCGIGAAAFILKRRRR